MSIPRPARRLPSGVVYLRRRAVPGRPPKDGVYLYVDTAGNLSRITDTGAVGAVGSAGAGGAIVIQEIDGNPAVAAGTLQLPNGTVADQGGGVARYTPASSGATTYTSAYASPPGSPAAGDLWLPSDSHYTFRYSGAAWVPFRDGRQLTLPAAAASWTWINQGSATATDTGGAVALYSPADAGDGLHLLVVTAPAAPYTVTALLRVQTPEEGNARFGLCWRRNTVGIGNGRLAVFGHTQNQVSPVWGGFIGGLVSETWSAATSLNANYVQVGWPAQQDWWLRIADTGANRVCSVSPDGASWTQVHSVANTDYFTPEQVGFYVNPAATSLGMAAVLLSWEVT